MTVKLFQPTSYGRRLVGLCHAVKIESEPEHKDDAYCTTFRTRMITSDSAEWTTIWSDSISWEIDA